MSAQLWIAALVGLAVGFGVRVATPHILRRRETALPFRLPWVELTAAIAFTALAWVLGVDWKVLPWYVFAVLLLTVSATDALAKLIPDVLTFSGAAFALAANALLPRGIVTIATQGELLTLFGRPTLSPHLYGALLSLAGAFLGFVLMELIRRGFGRLTQLDVMGFGDVKLMLMIGAFLGPAGVVLTLPPAFFCGVLLGIAHLLRTSKPHAPLGPSLALGAIIVLLFGNRLLHAIERAHYLLFSLPTSVILGLYGFFLVIIVLMVIRMKRRAAHYQRMIDEDYEQIERTLEP